MSGEPVIAFGQQPCGFFPRRFLVAKIHTARRLQAEMGGRAAMIKDFGWTKDTVKPGDKITLTGRKVKSGAPYMNLTDRANIVMTETGKEIFRTNNYGTEERKRPAAGLGNPAPGNPAPEN